MNKKNGSFDGKKGILETTNVKPLSGRESVFLSTEHFNSVEKEVDLKIREKVYSFYADTYEELVETIQAISSIKSQMHRIKMKEYFLEYLNDLAELLEDM